MVNDIKNFYDTKTVELIIDKLHGIKVISKDPDVSSRIMEIISLLKNTAVKEELSITEMIEVKMKEIKRNNPEMHFTLYKLYRSLEEGKTSEAEAYRVYKTYFG